MAYRLRLVVVLENPPRIGFLFYVKQLTSVLIRHAESRIFDYGQHLLNAFSINCYDHIVALIAAGLTIEVALIDWCALTIRVFDADAEAVADTVTTFSRGKWIGHMAARIPVGIKSNYELGGVRNVRGAQIAAGLLARGYLVTDGLQVVRRHHV